MKRNLYPEAFPFQSPIHSLHPSQCCLQQSLDGPHPFDDVDCQLLHLLIILLSVVTPLAWWLLTWHGHLTDTHPNHDLHLVIFCCFTLRLNVPCCLTYSHSHISMTFKAGIFASGNATCHYKYLWNRKRQTSPYYLLHCHAATSVFPLPVGPPIQYPLHPLSKVPCAFHTSA